VKQDGAQEAIGPLYTRIPKFTVNSVSDSVLKSVASPFTIGYNPRMMGAISYMKLDIAGTGVLKAAGVQNSNYPIVKYALRGTSLYVCPDKRCCQHWKLNKVAADNYDMILEEQDFALLCNNVRGLIPAAAKKLYGPKPGEGAGEIDTSVKTPTKTKQPEPKFKSSKSNREAAQAIFGSFPAKYQVTYLIKIGGQATSVTFFQEGTGKTDKSSVQDDKAFNMYWRIKDQKSLVITSNGVADCRQEWTIVDATQGTIKLMPEGETKAHCAGAAGFFPVTPITLRAIQGEVPDRTNEQEEEDIVEEEKDVDEAQENEEDESEEKQGEQEGDAVARADLGPFPAKFHISYNSDLGNAPTELLLNADGSGLTREMKPPGTPSTPNMKWDVVGEELVITSTVHATCVQKWKITKSRTSVFNLVKTTTETKSKGVDCRVAPGILPLAKTATIIRKPSSPTENAEENLTQNLIGPYPAVFKIKYADKPLLGAPTSVTVFENGKGQLKTASIKGSSEEPNITWEIKDVSIVITSIAQPKCSQTWTVTPSLNTIALTRTDQDTADCKNARLIPSTNVILTREAPKANLVDQDGVHIFVKYPIEVAVEYGTPVEGAPAYMSLYQDGTGLSRAQVAPGDAVANIKYKLVLNLLTFTSIARPECAQTWKASRDGNAANLVISKAAPATCTGVGLLPGDKVRLVYRTDGAKKLQKVSGSGPKKSVGNPSLFLTYPVVLKLVYAKPLPGAPYQITLNEDGTGNTKQATSPGSPDPTFTWKLKDKVLSLSSDSNAQCEQQWTGYFSAADNRHHIKLTKKQADNCASATGLLPAVEDIALEFDAAKKTGKGAKKSFREAIAKMPSEFTVSYDQLVVGAISHLKFLEDGSGIATAGSIRPPPGGPVPNFKWTLQDEKVLTFSSIESPACTQVWIGSLSGTNFVLELKTAQANGCGSGKGLLPTQYKKVTLTPRA
jgi:hypothetical protein